MDAGQRLVAYTTGELAGRPSWDQYFMMIAKVVSFRATCDRLHVGAVLVKDNHILSTGYNGAPRGLPHCDEVGHEMVAGHCIRTLHAEENAVALAAYHGTATEGATLYTQWLPCVRCAKAIINSGVTRVVFEKTYENSGDSMVLFKAAGVELVQLEG
jgi:dCMP deaminase